MYMLIAATLSAIIPKRNKNGIYFLKRYYDAKVENLKKIIEMMAGVRTEAMLRQFASRVLVDVDDTLD